MARVAIDTANAAYPWTVGSLNARDSVAADLAGRLLLAPIEVPVGIVTAIVGAPFLLWILLRPASRFH